MGIKYVFVTILLFVCTVLIGSGIFIRWGKRFRGQTASRYTYYASRQYKGHARD